MKQLIYTWLGAIVFVWLGVGSGAYAQKRPDTYKSDLKEADRLFIEEQYEAALPIYLALDAIPPREPKIAYAIGIIYANRKEKQEQLKGIPYLEYAVQHDKTKKEVPDNVYYHLGLLYHKNQETEKAVAAFKKVLESKKTLLNYKKIAREYIEMNE